MENIYGTYFLGSTIVNQMILDRIHRCETLIHSHFGVAGHTVNEKHITLLPPFKTDYVTASHLNMGCAYSTLLSRHPLTSALFSIGELGIMSFSGVDVLYFPVRECNESTLGTSNFVEYVLALRRKIKDIGIEYKETIPDEYTPHITVFAKENLQGNLFVQKLIQASKHYQSLYFNSGYLTLYTKYKDGWSDLGVNPNSF